MLAQLLVQANSSDQCPVSRSLPSTTCRHVPTGGGKLDKALACLPVVYTAWQKAWGPPCRLKWIADSSEAKLLIRRLESVDQKLESLYQELYILWLRMCTLWYRVRRLLLGLRLKALLWRNPVLKHTHRASFKDCMRLLRSC